MSLLQQQRDSHISNQRQRSPARIYHDTFFRHQMFNFHMLGSGFSSTTLDVIRQQAGRINRQLRRMLCNADSQTFSDHTAMARLEQSIFTNLRDPSVECVLIPRDITYPALCTLYTIASKSGYTLRLCFDSFNTGAHFCGFCIFQYQISGNSILTEFELHYIRDVELDLAPLTTSPPDSIFRIHVADLPSTSNIDRKLTDFGISVLERVFPCDGGRRDVLPIIKEFLPQETNISFYSRSLWEYMFHLAFVILPSPPVSAEMKKMVFLETTSNDTTYRSRKHKLFAQKPGFVYFWDDLTRTPPFVSSLTPEHLLTFQNLLWSIFPQARKSLECLTSEYVRSRDSLNFHSDKALFRFLRRFEFVILNFLGASRTLAIRPQPPHHHTTKFFIECSEMNTVVLTPMANEIFQHSKLPTSNTNDPHSLTLAFRTAIRITSGFRFYPALRNHFPNLETIENTPPINGVVLAGSV